MGGWSGFASWYSFGAQGCLKLLGFVVGRPGVIGAVLGGTGRAAEVKGTFDRTMQALLAVLSVPSRADYNRLLSKVEVIQGSLVNLNIKVDRLLAAREQPTRDPSGRSRGTGSPQTGGTE